MWEQVESATECSIQRAFYETRAWGQTAVYRFVQYVKKNVKTVEYLHYFCT